MKAIKYESAVRPGGKIEVVLSDMREGTQVEVIVLVRDDQSDLTPELTAASESSLVFWDNSIDDEVWNSA